MYALILLVRHIIRVQQVIWQMCLQKRSSIDSYLASLGSRCCCNKSSDAGCGGWTKTMSWNKPKCPVSLHYVRLITVIASYQNTSDNNRVCVCVLLLLIRCGTDFCFLRPVDNQEEGVGGCRIIFHRLNAQFHISRWELIFLCSCLWHVSSCCSTWADSIWLIFTYAHKPMRLFIFALYCDRLTLNNYNGGKLVQKHPPTPGCSHWSFQHAVIAEETLSTVLLLFLCAIPI